VDSTNWRFPTETCTEEVSEKASNFRYKHVQMVAMHGVFDVVGPNQVVGLLARMTEPVTSCVVRRATQGRRKKDPQGHCEDLSSDD